MLSNLDTQYVKAQAGVEEAQSRKQEAAVGLEQSGRKEQESRANGYDESDTELARILNEKARYQMALNIAERCLIPTATGFLTETNERIALVKRRLRKLAHQQGEQK
jgi:hypothetical protein